MRTRSDGLKFQNEVEKYCKKPANRVFYVRLRTGIVGYANLNNIADFILFSRQTVILEVKETGADAFSLNDFQQKEEIEKFKLFYVAIQGNYISTFYKARQVHYLLYRRQSI